MSRVIIFLFVLLAGTASAQYFDKLFFISWTANTPLANQDFAGEPTARGARLGYRELFRENATIGLDVTMATYDQYIPRQTYYSPGSAFTTDFTHFVNTYGATVSGEYLFFQERRLMPYAGVGVGVAYNTYNVYYNVYSSGDDAFGFLVRPRAGAWFRFRERGTWGINASLHLEYSTAKSEEMGYRYFLNPGFEIGLVNLNW
jgi:hypothetical protein